LHALVVLLLLPLPLPPPPLLLLLLLAADEAAAAAGYGRALSQNFATENQFESATASAPSAAVASPELLCFLIVWC
jgi:hypothetical protein